MRRNLTDKQKKILAASGVVLFLLLSAVIAVLVGKPMIRAASDPESFRNLIDSYGIWGKAAFVGMVILQVIVAVIPGEPLEIAAGYAFGAVWGSILCLIGMAVGGCLVFLFVKRFGVKAVEIFFPGKDIKQISFLKDSEKLHFMSFILLFIPGTPKDLICYFLGLTDMRFTDFLLISVFARVPSVITSTVGGNALGVKNYTFAILVFVITAIISSIGIFIYKKICAKKETKNGTERTN